MTTLPIKSATKSDQDQAIAIVVLAFSTDPVARWTYPDPHQYLRCFPDLVRELGRVGCEGARRREMPSRVIHRVLSFLTHSAIVLGERAPHSTMTQHQSSTGQSLSRRHGAWRKLGTSAKSSCRDGTR